MDEILVLAEHRQGELRDITFEMLFAANTLGKENDLATAALLLGHETSGLSEIFIYGKSILRRKCPLDRKYCTPDPWRIRIYAGLSNRKDIQGCQDLKYFRRHY